MLQIHPVPAFSDNYLWLLFDEAGDAFVVDPGDAEPVLAFLAAQRLRLAGILITHHHLDHTGGVAALRARLGSIPVFGPANSPFADIDHRLSPGDSIQVLGHTAAVLGVPGHTLDHIAYFIPSRDNQAPILFCGDTLFGAGCGRVFEGDPAMMHASLARLSSLPTGTRVCPAHEYTLSNLRFALAVEPENVELRAREARDRALRAEGIPTVPSLLSVEAATNPFLRCATESVRQAAATHAGRELGGDADVFGVVRAWKDGFR